VSRILAFVPAYNCAAQIGRTLAQFDASVAVHVSELIVVDNRSTDGTAAAARQALETLSGIRGRLLLNDANYGLGGSHKVAFDYALDHGFDYCLVVHGDDQARVHDILPLLARGDHRRFDCLLGARFMNGSRLVGYSRLRTLGNEVFNLLYSALSGRRLYDLGSGLNLYAATALADRFYARFADDLTFNYYLILASAAKRWRMRFFPIEWREEDQRSNVKLVRQSLKTLRIVTDFARSRARFLGLDHSGRPGQRYTWTVAFDNALADRAVAG
jgi:dolichol-phosphate mannosyltransferase